MKSLPEWTKPLLVRHNSQVSHGLNLVLKLDHPEQLPLLLWDIMLAQEKIKRALEDLSFVHFARFIPSWDGRALMVTTEFDGPLDPYVLDFVLALGDVFDTVLRYVKKPPSLPVREYPDEFVAWVRRWNRVPFYRRHNATLFPEDFDYPLYSAYPEKTVIDITGPRLEVQMPALDGPAASVDPTDVQGNILRGYHASQASYLFFTITDSEKARAWLAGELVDSKRPWLGVANMAPWSDGKMPAVCTQVAISYAGLEKLLPTRQSELLAFPRAFREGAAKRAYDNFDRGSSDPQNWQFGKTDEDHVVLFLYTKQEGAATQAYTAALTAVIKRATANGLQHLRKLEGESNGGYEPFGFRDGISEPRISGQCPSAGAASFQPAASPGEFLLHHNYASIYGGTSLGNIPRKLAGNGSFGVLRLIEQNKSLFDETIEKEAARLFIDKDRLRAKLMGRWSFGESLALMPQQPTPGAQTFAASKLNSFDYAPS